MSDAPHETSKEDSHGERPKKKDLGGRRKKADRRRRTTAETFPERRWLRHRRNGGDRRSSPFFNPIEDGERRDAFKDDDTDENDAAEKE